MNDNVLLIKDIKVLRNKVRELEKKLAARKTKKGNLTKQMRVLNN